MTSKLRIMKVNDHMEAFLARGTSPVDWCESNYAHSSWIAETINTISNILFLVFPPILMPLFKQYARNIDSGIYVIWLLFAVVGLCSAYFHATLSLAGQLLDELAILWLLAFAFGMWLPRRYYPTFLNDNRRMFKWFMIGVSALASLFALVYPWINSFALMAVGVPTLMMLSKELSRCRVQRVRRLGWRCAFCSIAAITAWVADRIFCDTWMDVNMPYLHGVWHILIAIASYTLCILFAYFDAIDEHEHLQPVLKYWPRDEFDTWGIPYIQLKNCE